jgi:hypothetical protein
LGGSFQVQGRYLLLVSLNFENLKLPGQVRRRRV